MKKKILALVLCVGLIASFATACGNDEGAAGNGSGAAAGNEEVYKFDVSFATPEPITVAMTETFERIEEASNGRIEFTYYYSWSLSSVNTIIDDFNTGIVDIGVVPINMHTNLFPYSNLVTDTPFMGIPSMEANTIIYDELYDEYDVFKAEFDNAGLHYWTCFANAPYHLFSVGNNAITTPADLNGVKLMTDDAMLQQYITNHGGAPVSSPVTEYATNLNTNVVDGAINHGATFSAFGCLDFLNSATIFGDQGILSSIACVCFSQDAWNSLPADLQQLFDDEATNLRDNYTAEVAAMADGAIQTLVDSGKDIVFLTEEQIAAWSEGFDDILADKIAELEKNGATEAQKYYDIVQDKIAAYPAE
ncbi:MAG: TRAP transporter substrate-binding protein DctP [Eubacterium sp.]|nr:TRAP transporter substrate-binding protein DctP [Eubacterium sp.]